MQVCYQVVAYCFGALACIFLSYLDKSIVTLIAGWYWNSLFYTNAVLRFRVLKFLSLSWSLFPWLTFFALLAHDRSEHPLIFLLSGFTFIFARLFNARLWSDHVNLFGIWIREQGLMRTSFQKLARGSRDQLQTITSRLANSHRNFIAETRYFESAVGVAVIVLGLSHPVYWKNDFERIILWFVAGLSSAFAFGFFRHVQHVALMRLTLVGLIILFLNTQLQSIVLLVLIIVTATIGVVRDVRTDMEREINPLSARRGSGELEMFDAQKIVRLRAVREFGDTIYLGGQYRSLLTIREFITSPSIRWSLVRLDGILAIWVLIFSYLFFI